MGLYRRRHWIQHLCRPAPPLAAWPGEGGGTIAPLPASWQCDLASEELRWSSGVFDLFGVARGAPIDRRSTLEFYADDSRKTLERLRAQALTTCGSFTFEAQIYRGDGLSRWMRVSADVQKSNGRAAVLYGTKQDITAEMAARGR